MKKRNIVIILILVIIVIVAILTTMYLNDKAKYVYKIEKVTSIDYNIINIDERYGVIDRQGNIIVEPQYDIIQIPNPSNPVFICMYDYDVEQKEYTTKVFNEKKEELYQGYSHVQAIPNETTEDGVPFEKTVLRYKQNGKYGLLNIKGEEILKAEYDQITSMPYKEGMLLISQNDKYGVINIEGKIVIDVEYDSIVADNYYNKETKYKATGFIVSKKTDDGYKYGYINYQGHKVLEPEYTEIERVTEIQDDKNVYIVALKEGQAGLLKNKSVILNHEYEDISYNSYNDVFIIQRNGKQGIADKKGKIKVVPEYDTILFGGIYLNAKKGEEVYILDLNGNVIENTDIVSRVPTEDGKHYIISNKDGKYKIIDKDGNEIINKGYSYIEEIHDNYYIVASGNKNGIIDLSGKSSVDLQYSSISKIEGTQVLQANSLNRNALTLIDKDMKIIASLENAIIQLEDNYIHLYTDKENRYFDFNGKELNYKEIYPNKQLYAKMINEKWGFVDSNGDLKIQNEYEMVTEFNEYGYAGIKKDNKWGVIDSNGNIIQEPIYKINWANPEFIGKYYKEAEWYGDLYYTNKIQK